MDIIYLLIQIDSPEPVARGEDHKHEGNKDQSYGEKRANTFSKIKAFANPLDMSHAKTKKSQKSEAADQTKGIAELTESRRSHFPGYK